MKQIEKFLAANYIDYSEETYGDRYFYNTPELVFPGVCIRVDNARQKQQIEKFIARAGYGIIDQYYKTGATILHVARRENCEALRVRLEYVKRSAAACNNAIHAKALGRYYDMTAAQFNIYLAGIMAHYEKLYHNAIAA